MAISVSYAYAPFGRTHDDLSPCITTLEEGDEGTLNLIEMDAGTGSNTATLSGFIQLSF